MWKRSRVLMETNVTYNLQKLSSYYGNKRFARLLELTDQDPKKTLTSAHPAINGSVLSLNPSIGNMNVSFVSMLIHDEGATDVFMEFCVLCMETQNQKEHF